MVHSTRTVAAYTSDLGKRVLDAVVRDPGSALAELAESAKASTSATRTTLAVLRSVGLVEARAGVDGRPAYYVGWRWKRSRGDA